MLNTLENIQKTREPIPALKRQMNGSGLKPTQETENYLLSVLGQNNYDELIWIDEKELSYIPEPEKYSGVANLQRINDIRRINKYFEQINEESENGSYVVVCMETIEARQERIFNKFPKVIKHVYYFLDFILKRVLPKWKPTRHIYFMITNGRNRVLSLSEALGRLVSCGYDILDYNKIGYETWIVAQKTSEPAYDMQATYGALIRLKRVGKDGKIIQVHKLRTMHPYSEYLQDFIFEKYDLKDGGKFNNDFRNTGWGKVFRKYWIDEFPMFINFFKGELKIVGVRPLSSHFFDLYPEDLKEMRIKVKPGLVPPYYADMPKGLDEIQESERQYLKAYFNNPIRTDIQYFFKSLYNILIKGARSS